jgi:hypothetical protein
MNVFNTKQKNKNMKHAREDYNRIQDPANLIPEDEPVFLLRAQDLFYVDTLRYYRSLLQHNGSGTGMRDSVTAHIDASIRWRNKNWEKIKMPDLPKAKENSELVTETELSKRLEYLSTLIEKRLQSLSMAVDKMTVRDEENRKDINDLITQMDKIIKHLY